MAAGTRSESKTVEASAIARGSRSTVSMGLHTCGANTVSQFATYEARDTDTHVNYLVPPLQKLVCFIGEEVSKLKLRSIV